MSASALTSRLKRCTSVRGWLWWQLPVAVRIYVAGVPVAAVAVLGVTVAGTHWRLHDLVTFVVLACCGMISVASTPRIMYSYPGLTRDFSTVWVLPTAILLPPVYAAIMPIPIVVVLQLFVHRGIFHRAVFTAASISLPYVAASVIFHSLPPSFAGSTVGTGVHALTWVVGVAFCEIIGGRGHHFLILGAVKLSDPRVRLRDLEWDRELLQGDFVELDLGALITLAVALTPALVAVALPTVLLVRRFLVFPILVAQSRTDAKTGLLNVSTWEKEAETEISRSVRSRHPVSLALVDIDHFKLVNDTYGHLVGDRVLKAVAEALTSHSRDYDRVGRFGGEEFVLLLAQTTETDACKIADRLRAHIGTLAVPVDDRPGAPVVQITVSIGVTAVARGEKHELTDMLAAADSALYHAKQAGRDRVAVAPPQRNMGLDTFNAHLTSHLSLDDTRQGADSRAASAAQSPRVVQVHVQANPTSFSLCQNRSLYVPIKAQDESDSLK
jgi:diguanylate cyclase (GGDEF)-like protein